MLRDLEDGPSLWVWALPAITGVNPVSPDDGGNIRKMSDAWLNWGREKGLRRASALRPSFPGCGQRRIA
jgi:hypothetical protein